MCAATRFDSASVKPAHSTYASMYACRHIHCIYAYILCIRVSQVVNIDLYRHTHIHIHAHIQRANIYIYTAQTLALIERSFRSALRLDLS